MGDDHVHDMWYFFDLRKAILDILPHQIIQVRMDILSNLGFSLLKSPGITICECIIYINLFALTSEKVLPTPILPLRLSLYWFESRCTCLKHAIRRDR